MKISYFFHSNLVISYQTQLFVKFQTKHFFKTGLLCLVLGSAPQLGAFIKKSKQAAASEAVVAIRK